MVELPYPQQDGADLRARSVRERFDALRRAIRSADVAAGMYRKALHAGIAVEIRETSAIAAARIQRRDALVVALEAWVTGMVDEVPVVHDRRQG